MFAIEGWGSLNHLQSHVEKNGEDNQKVGKIDQVVNQTFAFGPKHDKIQTRWALDISSKSMLEKV
jgi:hypothetical protein